MSTTNIPVEKLFETIGKFHIQVQALQDEIRKRDAIIAEYLKAQEATKAAQVPPPSPELIEKTRTSTPDA